MIEMMSVQPPDEFVPCDMVGRLCSHVSLASSSCLGNQEIVFFFFFFGYLKIEKRSPSPILGGPRNLVNEECLLVIIVK